MAAFTVTLLLVAFFLYLWEDLVLSVKGIALLSPGQLRSVEIQALNHEGSFLPGILQLQYLRTFPSHLA